MPSYMLHNALQEQWAGRQLVFFQIQFDAQHDPDRLMGPVRELLLERQVLSFAGYETLGEVDLFLRCWIPQGSNPQDLASDLMNDLSLRIRRCRPTVVSHILFHWPWMSEDYETYHEPRPTPHMQEGDFRVRLNRTLSDQPDGLTDAEIDEAVAAHVISPIGPELVEHGSEIKFIMTLSTLDQDNALRHRVVEGILESFRDLAREHIAMDGAEITQLSLYDTLGSESASFVIMGRVDGARFYEAIQRLYATLTETGFRWYFEIRPYTYLTGSPGFAMFQDALPVDLAEARAARMGNLEGIETLLNSDESATLEFKGSFYVQIRKWLLDDTFEPSDELFVTGIAREVAAFLNSTPGGVLLVGVLEEERELERIPKGSLVAAREKLSVLPSRGGKRITGLEIDVKVRKLLGDRDRAERHVVEKLGSLLDAPPTAGLVEVSFHEVEGRTVTVLAVDSYPASGDFAYLRSEQSVLYVRRGGSTEPLSGTDADAYRRRIDRDRR